MDTLRIEGYVTLAATNGEAIKLHTRAAGVRTGFGRVDNPYWDGDPDWRIKDGETVIECTADHPKAQPVADAYQSLYAMWAEERELESAWELEAERFHENRSFYGTRGGERHQDLLGAEIDPLEELQDEMASG